MIYLHNSVYAQDLFLFEIETGTDRYLIQNVSRFKKDIQESDSTALIMVLGRSFIK